MKYLERFFFRLNPREQRLLTIFVWVVLLLGFFKIFQGSVVAHQQWNLTQMLFADMRGLLS